MRIEKYTGRAQTGGTEHGGPNSATTVVFSKLSDHYHLPVSLIDVHLQRTQITWQDSPHHWRQCRYRRSTHAQGVLLSHHKNTRLIYISVSLFRLLPYCSQRYQGPGYHNCSETIVLTHIPLSYCGYLGGLKPDPHRAPSRTAGESRRGCERGAQIRRRTARRADRRHTARRDR